MIFSALTFTLARAIYRRQLTDKDIEIDKAKLGEQKALRKAEAAQVECDEFKMNADALKAASIKTALEKYEREERDGNFERAASILKAFFEGERRNLAQLAGGTRRLVWRLSRR